MVDMLHRYRFRNFASFREETEVSLAINRHVPDSGLVARVETGERLSKVLAVIGANASGKTNVLKPLAFLSWFVRQSFQAAPDAPIPIEPHFFFSEERECSVGAEFDAWGDLWRYEVTLTPERVLAEALYRKTSRLYSYVFEREWDSAASHYRIKQQGFGMNPREASKVRPNASLVSTAAQYGVRLAADLANHALYTNVSFYGRMDLGVDRLLVASALFKADEALRRRMAALLRLWDPGIADVVIRPLPMAGEGGETREVDMPFAVHRGEGLEVERIFFLESSGTQGVYVLLSLILPALATGGLAIIDELEAHLHPHMLHPILDLFLSPKTNPSNAQILFTCHAPEILNVLRKPQVLLVEKDSSGASLAWRLDSVRGVRADDNLYAKYMAGAYGAVPET
jgi:hypothetical protein